MLHDLTDKCAPASPHCPGCGQVMRFARITSRFGDLPDLYAFECRPCGVSHIEPALSAPILDALLSGACKKDLWTLATKRTTPDRGRKGLVLWGRTERFYCLCERATFGA